VPHDKELTYSTVQTLKQHLISAEERPNAKQNCFLMEQLDCMGKAKGIPQKQI
jgi:hypothetical protein